MADEDQAAKDAEAAKEAEAARLKAEQEAADKAKFDAEKAKTEEAVKVSESPSKNENEPVPEVRINNPAAPEAIAEQHQAVDDKMAKLNEENAEGNARNMQAIEDAAAEAHARTEHADDPRAGHVPTGKEDNHNTPRVLPDGTKVWP